MKKLLINIICGLIPNRNRRNHIRMQLKYHKTMKEMVKFAKSYSNKKHPEIKTSIGFGCHNFVVIVDDNVVFKFPIKTDGKEISIREKRITDALRPLSSIKIPKMEIIYWKNMAVRKYEFIKGISLDSFSVNERIKHADIIIKQLAKFLYEIGKADPKEIRDLKPIPNKKPSFMYGWFQNDLWYNFIMDPKTLKIKAFIDWEDISFCDFGKRFNKHVYKKQMKSHNIFLRYRLLQEYVNIYMHNIKK